MDQDLIAALQQFLLDNDLPLSLMDFIRQALVDQKPMSEIMLELRQTPEYKAAYPENELRRRAGFDWQPEAQIRAYRSEARRLSLAYLGSAPTDAQIANAIGNDKSLAELEKEFQVQAQVAKYGDAVKALFYQELGYSPSDERLFAFMHPEIPTPELDRAYESALIRGRTQQIGLGIRPEAEAQVLRQIGIDPDQAFKGYQGIATELPRAERLAAITTELERGIQAKGLPSVVGETGTPFGMLFRATFLSDPQAQQELQRRILEEVARFQAGGGPVLSGTKLVGLTSRNQRS